MGYQVDGAANHMINRSLIPTLLEAVTQVGHIIMSIYEDVDRQDIRLKADDSPVTEADLASNRYLMRVLESLDPRTPVVSEELALPDFDERSQWSRYWLVDPLDGTKEFVARNGEFTVNVALIESGYPVFGVVGVPARKTVYWGGLELGAFKQGAGAAIESCQARAPDEPLRLVGSRRHISGAEEPLYQRLNGAYRSCVVDSVGSALKFCVLAEGLADFYPRLSPTCEWDTAAGQALLEGAGGQVLDADGTRFDYGRHDSMINPDFFAFGLPDDRLISTVYEK